MDKKKIKTDSTLARAFAIIWRVTIRQEPVAARLLFILLLVKIFMLVKILRRRKVTIFGYLFEVGNSRFFFYTFTEIFVFQVYACEFNRLAPVILDCGAHVGLTALYFKRNHPEAKIDCFEPEESAYNCLYHNIIENRLSHVRIHRLAITDKKAAMVSLYFNKADPADPHSNIIAPKYFCQDVAEVDAKKISFYIDREIDLLKLDVEGVELGVLEELEQSAKLSLIKNIIMELHSENALMDQMVCEKIRQIFTRNGFSSRRWFSYNNRIDHNCFLTAVNEAWSGKK